MSIDVAKGNLTMAADQLKSASEELVKTVVFAPGPLQNDKTLTTIAILLENIATMTLNIRARL